MAQYVKVRIKDVITDKAQVYEDGKAIDGKFTQRIRALIEPIKPDPFHTNLSKMPDEIINTFRALIGKTVLLPGVMGATDNGTVYFTLQAGITIDDIDLLPEKQPRPVLMVQSTQVQAK